DVFKTLTEAKGHGLLTEVRQLATWDLVVKHATRGSRQAGLERRVEAAHSLPIRLKVGDGVERNAGVTVGVLKSRDEGGHRRLRGGSCHRCIRHVNGIDTCL